MSEEMQKLGQSIINEIKAILADLPNPEITKVKSEKILTDIEQHTVRVQLGGNNSFHIILTRTVES
jgi:hypothetical protein